MSDALKCLGKIINRCAEREGGDVNPEDLADHRLKLLELIVEDAGDCMEDHIVAREKATPKPIKERVYKSIVEQVSNLVKECDMTCPEGTYYTCELIHELLDRYEVPA